MANDEATPTPDEDALLSGETLAGWMDTVTLAGQEEPVRVVFVRRDGHDLLVRQKDPGEPDPPRIPIYEGDRLQVMQAISHVSVHLTEEVGSVSDLLFGLRLRDDAARAWPRLRPDVASWRA